MSYSLTVKSKGLTVRDRYEKRDVGIDEQSEWRAINVHVSSYKAEIREIEKCKVVHSFERMRKLLPLVARRIASSRIVPAYLEYDYGLRWNPLQGVVKSLEVKSVGVEIVVR